MKSTMVHAIGGWLLACSGFCLAQQATIPQYIQAAVANPVRPQKDKDRDANQKPAEVLAFAGVKPGDKVADFWPIPPYSTRLLNGVVGEKGHVYGVVPAKVVQDVPEAKRDIQNWFAPLANASAVIQPLDKFEVPEKLDLVYLGKIYHDFPNEAEMGPLNIDAVNKAIFRALKPGGVYVIVEHSATPGSGFLDTEPDMPKRLHRIDPEIVKKQVQSVGFVLEAESKVLANPDDTHTKSVFDPSIREKTDRFVFKFRKPK